MNAVAQLNAALIGRYAVDREIGAGGMATVYLARDLKHQRNVALKVLKPELGAVLGVERFLSEIRVTANLQHPNLLPLFDSGEANGLLFYVMPFVEGESLRARLDREKQLPVDEAVRISVAIAGALDYAHQHNVIHRDMKPENVLLQAGQPVIADFGIALAVSNAGGARVTQTGLSLGTPQYMSPEQATGDRVIDGRTDIYSLAAMTYEMLTGEPPHTGTSAQAIIAKLMTEDVRPLTVLRRAVPPHIDAAVRHGLEKLAADRFATAGEFSLALTGARPYTMKGSADYAGVGSASASSPLPVRIRVSLVVTAMLALAGVVTSLWLATRKPVPPVAARFTLGLPDSVTVYVGGGTKLAISRDGRQIAVLGQRGGEFALYLRRIEDPAAQVIRGSESREVVASGYSPRFSPDGAWLVYSTTSGLKKVSVSGGTTQSLADSSGPSSWGDGGVVVYVRANGLWLGTADGRDSKLLAAPDTAGGVFRLLWPSVLPGGEHALVTLDRSRAGLIVDSLRLGVVSLADGTVTDLGLVGTNSHYVPSGQIVFGRAGGLVFVAPFSLRSRTPTGPARLLLEDVWQGAGGATGFGVADNGTIAYHTGAGGTVRELFAVDRNGMERRIPASASEMYFPRVSPDGRRIVVGSQAFNTSSLWLVDAVTGARQRLTDDGAGMRGEWTRDGTRVVFIRPAGRGTEIVSRAWDRSGDDRVLARDSTRGLSQIALGPVRGLSAIRGTGAAADIFVAPTDSLNNLRPFVETTAAERSPALSSDGRLLAYESNESGVNEVYVQPIPGPGPRLQASVSGGTEPVWSRTGSTLFYRGTTRIMSVDIGGSPLQAQRRDSLFADIYDRRGFHQNWDVIPGGRGFLFLRGPRASNNVFVVLNWPQLSAAQGGSGVPER